MTNPKLEIFNQRVASHSHSGVDSPQIQFLDLSGVRRYRISIGTTTVTNQSGTTVVITTGGARFGDWVQVAAPSSLAGVQVTGYVSGAGTTSVRYDNNSTGTVTISNGTYNILILKP